MIRSLPHLLACLYNTPLMVTEQKLEAVLAALPAILAERASIRFEDGEPSGDGRPQRPTYGYTIRDGVATVPVHGVLVRRAGKISPDSEPLQSYQALGGILNRAVADQRVRGVLLNVDSPGGESGQAIDLARQIRALSQLKPVWAVADDDAMSAAYGLASAAQRVWMTATSGVGSIGTLAVHTDQTAKDARDGLKYSFVHAGNRKVDFTTHRPLSGDARMRLQAEVDRQQAMFVESVAAYRGLPTAAVSGTEAGLFFGSDAISAGLADQVGTPADAHAALAAYVTPSRTRSSAMSQSTEHPDPPPPPPPPQTQPNQPPAVQVPPAQPGQPQSDPPPQQAAHADVAQLGTVVAMARQDERTRGIEIAAACQLASRPDQIDLLMRSDMTAEQARAHLLRLTASAAAAARVTPTMTNDPATAGAPPLPPPIDQREAFATHRAQHRS